MIQRVLICLLRSVKRGVEQPKPPFATRHARLRSAIVICHALQLVELLRNQVRFDRAHPPANPRIVLIDRSAFVDLRGMCKRKTRNGKEQSRTEGKDSRKSNKGHS